MFMRMLVGLDGSDGSWKALQVALDMAKLQPDSELWAVSVEEGMPQLPETIDELKRGEGAPERRIPDAP